ncbi:type IV pilus secretin PilQ [Agaribacterium sp. ZY112]|uniref:type IV pilus secretin PilQ n=1 Tax=Agaribacterium sp. ZY112 TaxID=3233574 RepID=UPI00352459BE
MFKFIVKVCALWLLASVLCASELKDIQFAELPGGKAEIIMVFDEAPSSPKGFSINQPARIVLDFADVTNALSQKKFPVDVGGVSSAVVVAGGGRTRLIVNLDTVAPYTTRISGNNLILDVGANNDAVVVASAVAPSMNKSAESNSTETGSTESVSAVSSAGKAVRNLDFRRGDQGEGKVIISLSDSNVGVDIEEVASGVEVRFSNMAMPMELRRKLDVLDFATPVSTLASSQDGRDSVVLIEVSGDYDYLAYQADDEYVVSVKPLTRREQEEKEKAFAYTGERLSLNFQDIEVRSVLQLIADFTELNLVASDTVAGSITLRLENVPWDQALDIVLKSKGLDKRLIGNVLMVAPAAEIAERERQEIETQKQLEELAPLRTEYIRIRYANARELFRLFVGSEGGGSSGGSSGGDQNTTGSILSERGQAIVDERTNSIILTDTEDKILAFKSLIDRVDIPIQQVMIEARIVIANTDFRRELGVRMSGDSVETSSTGSHKYEFTGRMEGLTNADGCGPECNFIDSDGDGITDDERNTLTSNLVDLGVFNPTGAFTANVISSNFLLGLELSALQNSGFAEIVSQPKVITGDKQQASIESGTEVPYQEESASGGTTTAFKDAVLKLDVTPQVTPDDRVILDLVINQDSISEIDTASGVPVLDKTQLETQVLVSDGDTVVLGGIYTTENIEGQEKVPLLGDIPFLGVLFRHDIRREQKREILIFITPKIMSNDYVQ